MMSNAFSDKPLFQAGAPIAQRRRRYLELIVEESRRWYDTSGHWRLDVRPPLPHERMLVATAQFAAGDADFAHSILRQARTNVPVDVPYDIFDSNIAPMLLVRFRDQMDSDAVGQMEQLIRNAHRTPGQGNLRPALRAMGINDNMPAAAALGLTVGGAITGDDRAVEHGLWILRDYSQLLKRRTINAEFNSPTYTPLFLLCMADIANYATHPEVQQLAVEIEARLWGDLASRFHPEIGQLVGPFSRAYTNGMVGHFTNLSALLWMLLGDRIDFAPHRMLATTSAVIHLLGDVPFNLSQYVWVMLPEYHIPDIAWHYLHKKDYPHETSGDCEHAFFGCDFPAREGRIDTLIEREFGFGKSTTGFATGASLDFCPFGC